MKPVTEQDRIAARGLTKNLIKQFDGMGLQRDAERVCKSRIFGKQGVKQ